MTVFVRGLLCIVVVLTLASAHRISIVPPQAAGPVENFDAADFPGVIILHIHSDGDLHVHIHFLGSTFFYLGAPAPAVRTGTPLAVPVPQADELLPMLFNVGKEPLTGSLPLLGGLAVVATLVPCLLTALISGRLRVSPPDPPPQRSCALLAV